MIRTDVDYHIGHLITQFWIDSLYLGRERTAVYRITKIDHDHALGICKNKIPSVCRRNQIQEKIFLSANNVCDSADLIRTVLLVVENLPVGYCASF